MAYFSNGSEGDSFHSAVCMKCVHEPKCTVWLLHLLHNYDQCKDTPEGKIHGGYLDTLIKDGECSMFHAATETEIQAMHPPPRTSLTGENKPAPWIVDFLKQKGLSLE